MSNRAPHVRPDEPGTLAQQIAAIAEFYGDEQRDVNRDAAWQCARRRVMPHASALTGQRQTTADNGSGEEK